MTAQISDSLNFDGRRFSLSCEPLGIWLDRRKNSALRFKRINTACWRGYRAGWEIARGRLYLRDFAASWPDGKPATLQALFGNYSHQYLDSVGANDPANAGPGAFAFWVTGTMCCRFGKTLQYVHMDYESITEGELQLVMKDGFLVGQRIVHYERQGNVRHDIDELSDIEADFMADDSLVDDRPVPCERPRGFGALVGREKELADQQKS